MYLVCCTGSGKWNVTRVTFLIITPFANFSKFLRTPILKKICKQLLLRPVQISPGLPTSGSNWYICFSFVIIIYIFVCQFSLHNYWYCYAIRSSIVRSSRPVYNNCYIIRSRRPVAFCKKGALTNFAKFSRKQLCKRLAFIEVADL